MVVKHVLPADIERTSMEIISSELAGMGIVLPEETAAVVRRVIHTTADFDYVDNLRFTPRVVGRAVEALRNGAVIVTDTNMGRAGVNKAGLEKLNGKAVCLMAEPEIAAAAKAAGTTRAAAAAERAAAAYPQAVFAVGNAPTALLTLCGLIEEGLRPALVIAAPVGFVNVVESKRQVFAACKRADVPCIAAMGRKGGSNVAAAVCNALIYTALDVVDPAKREAL